MRNRSRSTSPKEKAHVPAQAAIASIIVIGVLLAILVIQNSEEARIDYLVWSARLPLAAALLISAALGALVALLASYLRARSNVKASKPAAAPPAADTPPTID
jgi:uncharacterized integral membrane protein